MSRLLFLIGQVRVKKIGLVYIFFKSSDKLLLSCLLIVLILLWSYRMDCNFSFSGLRGAMHHICDSQKNCKSQLVI